MTTAVPRNVIVDDADSRIRYSGSGWFLDQSGSLDAIGNFGPTYEKTLQGTDIAGSFSFAFTGTSVNVFGTIAIQDNGGVVNPTWDCFVDDIKIAEVNPTFAFPENNWSLCNQAQLVDGSHVLTANISFSVNAGPTFWVDYILYVPSPSISTDTDVIRVDNTDSGVKYSAGWFALENSNVTQIAGSQVTFNFIATSISLAGFAPSNLASNATSGTYTIDGGDATSFVIPGLASPGTTVYNQLYFNITGLSVSSHQLVVTYHGSSAKAPLAVDYFYIANASSSHSTTSASATTSGGGGAVITSGGSTFTSGSSTPTSLSSSSTSTSNSSSSSSHIQSTSVSVGPIVGGVIGGLFVIAIICLLIFFLLRRRRQTASQHQPGPLDLTSERTGAGSSFAAVPYSYLSQSAPSEGASSLAPERTGSSFAAPYPYPNQRAPPESASHLILPVGSPPSTTSSSQGWSSSSHSGRVSSGLVKSPPPRQQIMTHQDSGVRLAPNREQDPMEDLEIIEMPPQYTTV